MMDNPSANATPAAKTHQCHLYILVLFHFVMGILLTVANPPAGIMELIIPLILLCTAYSMNFCTLIFYMILMLNDVVLYLSAVGLVVQNGDLPRFYRRGSGLYDPFLMTVYILWFVFSIIALVVSFYAYREFKGMAYDSMGMQGGAVYGGMMRGMNNRAGGRRRSSNDSDVEYGQPLNPQQQQ
jgi:hypothetical protein